MSPTEAIPLLIVVFLLLAANGVEPAAVEMHFDGERTLEEVDSVLIVAGGDVSVPEETTVAGRVYVIDGRFEVAGTVDGHVTQLAGRVSVPETGAIAGEFRTLAGESSVAEGAQIGTRSVLEVEETRSEGGAGGLFVLLHVLGLAAIGFLVARWRPELVENVAEAVVGHPGVSTVTGGFVGAVALVLLVFMAFTILLLPVSALGLGALGLAVAFGQVAIGYAMAGPLPVERPGRRAGVGAVLVVVFFQVVELVPLVGSVLVGVISIAGFGAALITYFGLRTFEPPVIPGPS